MCASNCSRAPIRGFGCAIGLKLGRRGWRSTPHRCRFGGRKRHCPLLEVTSTAPCPEQGGEEAKKRASARSSQISKSVRAVSALLAPTAVSIAQGTVPGYTARTKTIAALPAGVKLDLGGDKTVQEQLRRLVQSSVVRVADLFRSWDTNGDGQIDRDEWHIALQKLSEGPVPRETSDALFDAFDVDGSDAIDYRELLKGVTIDSPTKRPS